MTQQQNAITPRHFHFQLADDIPKHWHSNDPFITHFFNGLSTLFPEGERFFVDSVRHYRNQITDPKLKEEVRGFIAQEALHSREHIEYNRILKHQGYDIDKLDRRLNRLLSYARKYLSPKRQLATTCALEHFTAIMAASLLEDPEWLQGADPRIAMLWRWHALEETEHKAVCYDVYQTIGGGYFCRTLTMIEMTLLFFFMAIRHHAAFLRRDGLLFNIKAWLKGLNFLWGKPGILRRLFFDYFDYFRPNFHPWQHNNKRTMTKWQDYFELHSSDLQKKPKQAA